MFDRVQYKKMYKDVRTLAFRIKSFFRYYSANRHKVTTLPPTFHYEPEGCDDNRFDMRPHLYATDWSYQFKIIDERVQEILKKESSIIAPDYDQGVLISRAEHVLKFNDSPEQVIDLPKPLKIPK